MRGLLAAAFAVALAGCSSRIPPGDSGDNVREPAVDPPPGTCQYDDSMQIRTELSPNRIRPGEDLSAHIVLDNGGRGACRMLFASGCRFSWVISNDDGAELRPAVAFTQATSEIRFNPDGLFEQRMVIKLSPDYVLDWPFSSDGLPPGTYTLKLFVCGADEDSARDVMFYVEH